MLGGAEKKLLIETYEFRLEMYQQQLANIITESEATYEIKKKIHARLKELLEELKTLPNQEEIRGVVQLIGRNISIYQKHVNEAMKEIQGQIRDEKIQEENNLTATAMGVGGAAAGAGVAVFGPTAALALAMNFGVAAGGAPIAGLGGAAAMNAALAWLGGGAIAAGGGGIAAGNALLGLAGPIGWTIAGVGGVAALYKIHANNQKGIEKIREANEELSGYLVQINNQLSEVIAIKKNVKQVGDSLATVSNIQVQVFKSEEIQRNMMIQLMRASQALNITLGGN